MKLGKGRRARQPRDDVAPKKEAVEQTPGESEPQILDDGPYDISAVGRDEERLDLGSIQISPGHDVELRLEMDQETGRVTSVTAVLGESALQIVAFAAPRSRGIWADVRAEIVESVTSQGGHPEVVDGDFGEELHVPQAGGAVLRLVGVDGRRWMVRGAFNGPAATSDGSERDGLEAVFRSLVVVRGEDAMPPREQLPLRLPEGMEPEGQPVTEDNPERPPLYVPRRGPEITEIR